MSVCDKKLMMVSLKGALIAVALLTILWQRLSSARSGSVSPDTAIRDKNSEIGLFTVLEVVNKDAVYLKYKTTFADLLPYEVVWEHRGVLEYVVDLAKAKVERIDDKTTGKLLSIVVTVPKPFLDEKTLNPVLDNFENKMEKNFSTHTGDAMRKVKAVAKKTVRDNLQHIAALGFDAEASQATRKALVAMYKSVDATVPVEVIIEEEGK